MLTRKKDVCSWEGKGKEKNHLPIINFKIRGPLLNSKLEMVVACFTMGLPWHHSQPKFVHLSIQNASSQKMHCFFLKYFIHFFFVRMVPSKKKHATCPRSEEINLSPGVSSIQVTRSSPASWSNPTFATIDCHQ